MYKTKIIKVWGFHMPEQELEINIESVGRKCDCYLDYFKCGECKNQVASDADNGCCHGFFSIWIVYNETDTKRYCTKYEKV